jgi:hypothetical protein
MRRPSRRALLFLFLLLVAALGAFAAFALVKSTDEDERTAMPPPLEASSPEPQSNLMRACGRAILTDWFDNGQVDRMYKRGCYGAALNLLPEDGEPGFEHRIRAEIRRAYLILGPRSKASRLPSSLELPCRADAAGPPCGPGARIGIDYAHVLYTHCGIESTIFDGRLWLARPPLNNGFRNPPPGWGDPTSTGIMRMLAEDEADFMRGSLVARFTPAPPGYQREACD